MQGPLDQDVRRPQQRWFHPRHAEGGDGRAQRCSRGPRVKQDFIANHQHHGHEAGSHTLGPLCQLWDALQRLELHRPFPARYTRLSGYPGAISTPHPGLRPQEGSPHLPTVHPPPHPRESRSTALCRRPRTGRHAPTAAAGRPGLPAPPPDPIRSCDTCRHGLSGAGLSRTRGSVPAAPSAAPCWPVPPSRMPFSSPV